MKKYLTNIEEIRPMNQIDIDWVVRANLEVKSWKDEKSEHFVKNSSLLESSINGVYANSHYYDDSNLTILANIWYRIVKNHPFSNGNKRTAIYMISSHIIYEVIEWYFKNNNYFSQFYKNKWELLFENISNQVFEDINIYYNLSVEIAASSQEEKTIQKNIDKICEIINSLFEKINFYIIKELKIS